MRDQLAVLLAKTGEHLQELDERVWPSLVEADEVSDEGLYLVRAIVQDLQSALDWVATAVDQQLGRQLDRSPYFPLRADQTSFDRQFDRDFPGLRQSHAEVYEAFARHQPYVRGRAPLGYLHDLSRVNKHQHFTRQTRDLRGHWSMGIGGLSVQYNEGRGLRIGGSPPYGHLVSGLASSSDGDVQFARGQLVTWNFVELGEAVQTTLLRLSQLVYEACADVCDAASL